MTIQIKNTVFRDNQANGLNTIYLSGYSECNSTLDVENCRFFNNRRSTDPTAICFCFDIYMGGAGGKMDINIYNSLFAGNASGISSICTEEGGKLRTRVNNCTFYGNETYNFNKNYFTNFDGVSRYTEFHVNNCIVWEPESDFLTIFSANSANIYELGGFFVDYTLISLSEGITNNYSLFGEHLINNEMPQFIDINQENFGLQDCSPGVNAGNNAIPDTFGILTDLLGNPRIQFDTVDMGAYETMDSCVIVSSFSPVTVGAQKAISPNPFTDKVNIHHDGRFVYRFLNAQGQLLQRGTGDTTLELNLESYPKGIYFFIIEQNNQHYAGKLIKH